MPLRSILAIAGALCGTTGSIITAFSFGRVRRKLNLNQQFLSVTVEMLATAQGDVPVFKGTERRFNRAGLGSTVVLWLGAALLGLGFIPQAGSIVVL